MPWQNRVTPFGEIIATPERGTLYGNRGCLHDDQKYLKRPYQGKRWIYCQLALRPGRSPRLPMPPNAYTGLFFLDEATALAAGHRPCAECKHPRFKQFRDAWQAGNPNLAGEEKLRVDYLDGILHRERLAARQKVTYPAALAELPEGSMITLEDQAYLVMADNLRLWSPGGYGPALPRPAEATVQVLTPRSVVQAIRAGFRPELHPSALLSTA